MHRQSNQDLDAERSVLGAAMRGPDYLDQVIDLLSGVEFYAPKHQMIFRAIKELYDSNIKVDITTVANKFNGDLSKIGGRVCLVDLVEGAGYNTKEHINIVREMYALRQFTTICENGIQQASERSKPSSELIALTDKRLVEIGSFEVGAKELISDLIPPAMSQIEAFERGDSGRMRTFTGISRLDEIIGGIARSNTTIVAGYTTHGKTQLCLQIALHSAIRKQIPVLYYSLEMPADEMAIRCLCYEANVPFHKISGGNLDKSDWDAIARVSGTLGSAPLRIRDTVPLTLSRLRSGIRSSIRRHGTDLVVIDYLQLITPEGEHEGRAAQVEAISRDLRLIALELKIPIIAVSQISRTGDKSKTLREPMLIDLKGSGSLEQDAFMVLFTHRYGLGRGKIIVAKHRNGELGECHLNFTDGQWREE